jgi:hypothetical protein
VKAGVPRKAAALGAAASRRRGPRSTLRASHASPRSAAAAPSAARRRRSKGPPRLHAAALTAAGRRPPPAGGRRVDGISWKTVHCFGRYGPGGAPAANAARVGFYRIRRRNKQRRGGSMNHVGVIPRESGGSSDLRRCGVLDPRFRDAFAGMTPESVASVLSFHFTGMRSKPLPLERRRLFGSGSILPLHHAGMQGTSASPIPLPLEYHHSFRTSQFRKCKVALSDCRCWRVCILQAYSDGDGPRDHHTKPE